MNSRFWASVLLLCVALALVVVLNPTLGLVAGVFVGLYLATHWWFTDHPATWWYDLLFWLVILGSALTAAGIFRGFCAAPPFSGVITRVCQTHSFGQVFTLYTWVLGFVGFFFWCWHLWIRWKLKR